MLLPRPPGMNERKTDEVDSKSANQRVWELRNGQPNAITIRQGLSDGLLTEVLGGLVEVGMELVTEELMPLK